MPITPTQSNVQAALRSFLLAVLAGNAAVAPAVFVGTIAGTVLTVASVLAGTIAVDSPVLGAAPGTVITALGTGTGGPGTYTISIDQEIDDPTTMSTGVSVVSGQANRAPETVNPFFVVMTPIRFERIETNVDSYQDSKFTGSIAGTLMTVSAFDPVLDGPIEVGSQIFGVGVAAGTIVTALGTGSGGTGTYQVSPSQTLSSRTLSAGVETLEQPTKVTVQLDFHSPDLSTAGDMAQTVSTLFRDDFAVQQFANQNPNYGDITPLYADDPKQVPFINDQQQYEWRWVVEAMLQANQVVSVPQQFADQVTVEIISVDASYPPS